MASHNVNLSPGDTLNIRIMSPSGDSMTLSLALTMAGGLSLRQGGWQPHLRQPAAQHEHVEDVELDDFESESGVSTADVIGGANDVEVEDVALALPQVREPDLGDIDLDLPLLDDDEEDSEAEAEGAGRAESLEADSDEGDFDDPAFDDVLEPGEEGDSQETVQLEPDQGLLDEDIDTGAIADDLDTESLELERDDSPPPRGARRHQPTADDTLPPWDGRARDYTPKAGASSSASSSRAALGKSSATSAGRSVKPVTGKLPAAKGGKPPTGRLPARPGTVAGRTPVIPPGVRRPAPAAASGGTCSVFLTPPRGNSKREAAADIIAEVQGIGRDEAMTLTGKMVIPVLKDGTEAEAQDILERLKAAGLTGRVTKKR